MATVISQGTVLQASPPRPVLHYTVTYRNTLMRAACARQADICIAQGDDYRVLIDVVDENAAPVDLRGLSEARFTVSQSVTSGAAAIDKRLSASAILLGANHQLYFDLGSAETGALAARWHHHELRLSGSTGLHQTVLLGRLTVQDTFIGG